MLNLISVKPSYKRLTSGEFITYLQLPELTYDALAPDLNQLPHFESIKQVDLTTYPDGVIIRCQTKSDGLLAATYLIRKYEDQKVASGYEEDEDDDYPAGEDPFDSEEEEGSELLHDFVYGSTELIMNLPIIEEVEFRTALMSFPARTEGLAQFRVVYQEEHKQKLPYWLNEKFPLIITESLNAFSSSIDLETFSKVKGRFIIYIKVESTQQGLFVNQSLTNAVEQRILFELDYALLQLTEPSKDYYTLILTQVCTQRGFKIHKSVDKAKLIDQLKDNRGLYFDSASDIVTLIDKVVRHKKTHSGVLTQADFDNLFVIRTLTTTKHKETVSTSKEELDALIGLGEVKSQLYRIVDNLKFIKQRRAQGYTTSTVHMAAVFMGNPGSAKTTVARLFGKILFEQNLLTSTEFIEASRKDLVGAYVGHTAPLIGKVFEVAKNGVLFIDEAYSLMSEGRADGYSEEALSEIVRQMENNPGTLVIFAGYEGKMRNFITQANPGLRSRLTNVIEFEDYTTSEMCSIFEYMLKKEDFVLENRDNTVVLVTNLVQSVKRLGSENTGNGRLMRRLFKTAVSYMAQRDDNDLKTITLEDIQNAINQILSAETLVSHQATSQIGFTRS